MRSPIFRSVLLFAVVPSAHAAPPLAAAGTTTAPTFTVNSLGPDPAGGDLTNGICETAPDNGICTLRAATMKANHYAGGGVTIIVPAGVYYLSSRESVESEATGDLNLTAPVTILGAGADKTVIDALDYDEVLHNSTSAELSGLSLVGGRRSGQAGGVLNEGTLTLRNCRVGDNVALGFSGNDLYNGGGIYNTGTLALIGTSVDHNRGGFAGAVNNYVGATTTISNSTISDNLGAEGGGILNFNGAVSLEFSTVAGNVCTTCNACNNGGGISSNQYVSLKASLIYGNFSCYTSDSDFEGNFKSYGYNLRGNGGSWVSLGAPDQILVDPLLQSPGSNGGPTPTRPLLAGSPAIDAVPSGDCTDLASQAVTTDQRGAARPAGAACDVGAFEGSVPAGFFGRNLLRNGDAEAAAGSRDEAVPAQYWVAAGASPLPIVVTYCLGEVYFYCPSTALSLPSPGPADRGRTFFAGGDATDAYAQQDIALAPIGSQVAAGGVSFRLSGFLGGLTSEEDYAEVTLQALDNSAGVLQTAKIGPVSAGDRGNITGLLYRRVVGSLNPASGTLRATLHFHAAAGYDDGYADNLALVLFDVADLIFADDFEGAPPP